MERNGHLLEHMRAANQYVLCGRSYPEETPEPVSLHWSIDALEQHQQQLQAEQEADEEQLRNEAEEHQQAEAPRQEEERPLQELAAGEEEEEEAIFEEVPEEDDFVARRHDIDENNKVTKERKHTLSRKSHTINSKINNQQQRYSNKLKNLADSTLSMIISNNNLHWKLREVSLQQ